MKEIFKTIPNYPDYQVSNLGRIKSISRSIFNGHGYFNSKEKILKPQLGTHGYYHVGLYLNNNRKTIKIHQLVAIAFLDHIPNRYKMTVDHVNNIRTDNRLENIQVITPRENSSKDRYGGASKYIGVCWDKARKKWKAQIKINENQIFLGRYEIELQAKEAYQKGLKNIDTYNRSPKDFRKLINEII